MVKKPNTRISHICLKECCYFMVQSTLAYAYFYQESMQFQDSQSGGELGGQQSKFEKFCILRFITPNCMTSSSPNIRLP